MPNPCPIRKAIRTANNSFLRANDVSGNTCACGKHYTILQVITNLVLRKMKKREKANAELYYEIGKLDDKIRELEDESSKHASDTGRFVHDFVRKDKIIIQDNKSK